MEKEQGFYLEAYYENEYKANKLMSYACGAISIVLVLVWLGYLTGLFSVSLATMTLLNISMPISIAALLSTLITAAKEVGGDLYDYVNGKNISILKKKF